MPAMRVTAVTCCLILSTLAPAETRDRVKFRNASGQEKGVLVDGSLGGSWINDRAYTSPQLGSFFSALFPSVLLDNFRLSGVSDEVIAFERQRAPTLVTDVAWTGGSNTVEIEIDEEYRIPVTAWIVKGPFGRQRQLAVDQSVDTSQIWFEERQGVAFEQFRVRDVTADSDAAVFYTFDCSLASFMRSSIGFDPGRINIYYVSSVDFNGAPSQTAGVWCGFGTIAMGGDTSGPLLAHEIGHAFDLDHVNDDIAYFDTTNVMHNQSSSRRYLTEGQTFRATHSPFSSLNDIYDVRDGRITRSCPYSLSLNDATCPAVQKRLWGDGSSWPAN